MTDPNTTRAPMPPDMVNAIVRDMDDPRFPTQITVFCDHCGVERTADYMVSEDMTKTERLAVARQHLVQNEGWEHTEDGDDFCPEHAGSPADEQTATLLVDRTSSTCGGCGEPTLSSALTHADVSGYDPKPGGGCGARFVAIRSANRAVTEEHLRSLRPDLPVDTGRGQQMPDRPYTDDDLRAQAALCQSALSTPPTVGDILRWLPGAYVTGRSGDTWGDVLDNTSLAETARKIHELIEQAGNTVGALNSARWLIDLGADGLVPAEHSITVDPEQPRVRVLFAFPPETTEEQQAAFVHIIAGHIGIRTT